MATTSKLKKGEKTEAMRAFQEQHPGAPAAEVVAGLKKQGIGINLASVYNFRTNSKKAGSNSVPKKPAERATSSGSGHGSKSQAVRAAILKLGRDTPSKEIIDHLSAQGIPVSLALVVKVKSRMKARRKARRLAKRGRPAGVTAAAAVKVGQLSFDDLMATKELADRLGGMDSLRRTLDVLEKLR